MGKRGSQGALGVQWRLPIGWAPIFIGWAVAVVEGA